MTDKEIIIDGVDVSECDFLNACNKKIKCIILQDDVCETNPYCKGWDNCYYKQLKRLEAENKRLKEIPIYEQCEYLEQENKLLKATIRDKNLVAVVENNDKLEAENAKLKEDYIKLNQQKDLDNVRWQKRCTDLHIEDKAKADKYWLVLQEIKEIAKTGMHCEGIGCDFMPKILQKISEVDNE